MPGALPCPDCGCVECEISADDFTRADSDSLGSLWSEVSGDFDINTNKLQPSSNGILECTTDLSAEDYYRFKWVVFFGFTIGATRYIRIRVDVVDSNNYHYAEIKPIATFGDNHITVELVKVTGGTPATLSGPTRVDDINSDLANDQTIAVCMSPERIICTVNSAIVPASTTAHGGSKVQLETVNLVSSARFDDMALDRTTGNCPGCISANETCDACDPETSAPPYMQVDVSGLTGIYAAANGSYALPYQGCNAYCLTLLGTHFVDEFPCSDACVVPPRCTISDCLDQYGTGANYTRATWALGGAGPTLGLEILLCGSGDGSNDAYLHGLIVTVWDDGSGVFADVRLVFTEVVSDFIHSWTSARFAVDPLTDNCSEIDIDLDYSCFDETGSPSGCDISGTNNEADFSGATIHLSSLGEDF
jgi:hypothetical protein